MKIKQTAGRKTLGEFAPKFAKLNDDVLFGDVWSGGELSLRERSVVTIVALMAQGLCDSSFRYHLETAKKNGVTRGEIAEILTHAAFYCGWSKAWAAFNVAKDVWKIGNSYLAPVSNEQVGIYNVTFEPKCRNNWHVHRATKGGGQILICIAGRGYYQEYGKPAQELFPGDVVNIPSGVKHWHGAAPDSWFSHLAVEVPSENGVTDWFEPVDDKHYNKLK